MVIHRASSARNVAERINVLERSSAGEIKGP
jgi:hypothetical protein